MKNSKAQSLKELNLMGLFLRLNLLPIVALLAGGATGFISLAAYIYESQRSEYIPYLVTVDRQGAVLAREELKVADSIPDRVIAWVLSDFAVSLNGRSSDSLVQEQRIRKVYALIKKDSLAADTATKYYRNHNPMDTTAPVSVDIRNIKRLTADSFEIDLDTTDMNGKDEQKAAKKMVITYKLGSGFNGDLDFLKLNPLNMQIESFSLSENNYK